MLYKNSVKSRVFGRLGRAGILLAVVAIAAALSPDPKPNFAHNGFVFPRNLDLDSLQKAFDATSIFDRPAVAFASLGFSDQGLAG